MRTALAIGLLVSVASMAAAEPFAMDLPTGDHYLKITVAANGSVSAVPLRVVKVGQGPTNPQPDPQPSPELPDSDLQKAVRQLTLAALASGGSSDTAAKLAQAFASVSDECSAGNIPPELVFGTQATPGLLPRFMDSLLASATDKAVWQTWRTGVSGELTKLRDAGKLTSKEDVTRATLETSVAMRAVLEQRGILNGIPWDDIKREVIALLKELLLKLLLETFKPK